MVAKVCNSADISNYLEIKLANLRNNAYLCPVFAITQLRYSKTHLISEKVGNAEMRKVDIKVF
jgi:hypothetical protein